MSYYIAKVVEANNVQKYLDVLQFEYLPVWSALQKEGYLKNIQIFQLDKIEKQKGIQPAWNFLMLSRITKDIDPSFYIQNEEKLIHATETLDLEAAKSRKSLAKTLKIEILQPIPDAFFPEPASESTVDEKDLDFLVEYICVKETKRMMDKYREYMRDYGGPAFESIIAEGKFYNFVALETVDVAYIAPELSTWNQIHICGVPKTMQIDEWKTLIDAALKEKTLGEVDLEKLFDQLDKIRYLPRFDRYKKVLEC